MGSCSPRLSGSPRKALTPPILPALAAADRCRLTRDSNDHASSSTRHVEGQVHALPSAPDDFAPFRPFRPFRRYLRSRFSEGHPLSVGLAAEFGQSRKFRYGLFAQLDWPARLRPGA